MSLSWKLFMVVCVLQLLLTAFFTCTSVISLFQTGDFYYLFQTLAFGMMVWLAILALGLLNNNYPDVPVSGRQKTIFNWLFLVNFLLITFLFGLIFAEFGQLRALARLTGRRLFAFPFEIIAFFFVYFAILLFQFTILYGLYTLRRELYRNFMEKQFEFEGKDYA